MIIEGRSKKPTYLWINDDSIKFRDAKRLWGLNCMDCQRIIKEDINEQNARIACIGPAGENLSRIACIINESRAAGRKGLGAVMGSKNLKAIVVRGSETFTIASKKEFRKARKDMMRALKDSPVLYPVFSKVGSSSTLPATSDLGIFPSKNWSATGDFTPIEKMINELSSRKRGNTSCYNCPIGCTQLMLAEGEYHCGISSEGPEFETLYSFGGQTGVDCVDSIIAADRLADDLGLDTISAGVVIGFAMELYEKGILNKTDTEGIDLRFGNHQAMIKLINMIAFREGFGDLLADGVKKAAERIGEDAEKYALHVKGLELPGYDVRGAKSQGLNYATAYTGADHNRGYAAQEIFGAPIPFSVDGVSVDRKAELTKWNQDVQTAIADCPTICAFPAVIAMLSNGVEIVQKLMEALTGLSYTSDEIIQVGERVNNLARAFNVREGFTRKDDTLPERLAKEPIPNGPSKGYTFSKDELEMMLDEYYAARGWDPTSGIPTRNKLVELGLNYVVEQIV
jgi:aldehyde:ferredoxin oxidoreductase